MTRTLWPLFPVFAGLCQPFIWATTLRLTRHSGAMEASVILHGVTLLAGINRAVPVVGAALTTALLVAAQLSFSLLFEHYGWLDLPRNPATPVRALGVALLVAGAFLVSRTG